MSEKDLNELLEEAINANLAMVDHANTIDGLADALSKIGKYNDDHAVRTLATEISLKIYKIYSLLEDQHSAIVDAREEIDVIDDRSKYDGEDDD